ncbi:hypothetical protein ACJ72_03753 [Emergomyces africanus]|uniref:Uncharacterized protein n=1 Tax=Emergomyces africanus TaxID=1955775 RepID=A0A1B7NYQ1_9EURO|nr:hypothetical protein ACJ72_03753 [Emergomyces africanus]
MLPFGEHKALVKEEVTYFGSMRFPYFQTVLLRLWNALLLAVTSYGLVGILATGMLGSDRKKPNSPQASLSIDDDDFPRRREES